MNRAWLAVAVLACVALPAARGEKYALLVGVREYDKNELRNLQYSEDDVTDLAALLKDAGYRRVVLMTQKRGATESRYLPLAANVRKELKGLLEGRDEGDSVLVAVSGHGVQFAGDDSPYFCPMDARLTDKTTLVALKEVYAQMEQSRAGSKVLLADCCRDEPQSKFSRGRDEVQLDSVTRPQKEKPPGGVVALFACSSGEHAFESPELKHGIFFHFVMEGLKGKATVGGDKAVTLEGLSAYVKKQVNDQVKEEFGADKQQRPELVGKLSGTVALVGGDASANAATTDTTRPTPDKPKADDAPADGIEAFKALKNLLSLNMVAPDQKEHIRVGLWLVGPPTREDLARMDEVTKAMRKADARVAVVELTDFPDLGGDYQRVCMLTGHCPLATKVDKILDDKTVDVLLLFGSLRAARLSDDFAKTLDRDAAPAKLVDQSIIWGCATGKDVYIEATKEDQDAWRRKAKTSMDKDVWAAPRKTMRLAWVGGDLEEFFACVRSRKVGSGDIRGIRGD